ncbi:MAG: hypothetical protein JSV36_06055 [Anaerolineae bacterium]|nr:MAG: hypothetical protein JSV36_06055 [Anaerolineae bacterium]
MFRYVMLVVLAVLILVSVPGQAQSPNHAGLVIHLADGRVETACIEFVEDEITGVDLLNRSGLPVTFDYGSGLGAKVCKIGQTGCDYSAENCWCRCQGVPCIYWNYWQLRDGQWFYSPLGAGDRRLGDGDVDGWVWGDGQQPPPPLLSVDEICQVEVGSFVSPLASPAPRPAATRPPPPTATHPVSPLSLPTATSPVSPLALPTPTPPSSALPTSTPATKVFVPATSGETPEPKAAKTDLPPSPDRYVGLAGVLASLGLILLTVWRRRTGV